jgi:hypothetical protein
MRQWPVPATKGRVSEHGDGLESVKKTHQVAGVGKGSYARPDFSAATGRRKPAAV